MSKTIAEVIEIEKYILNGERVGVYYAEEISAYVVVSEEDYHEAFKLPAGFDQYSHWCAGGGIAEIPESLVEAVGFDAAWEAAVELYPPSMVDIVNVLLGNYGRRPNGPAQWYMEDLEPECVDTVLEELIANEFGRPAAALADWLLYGNDEIDGFSDMLEPWCRHWFWAYQPELITALQAVVDERARLDFEEWDEKAGMAGK